MATSLRRTAAFVAVLAAVGATAAGTWAASLVSYGGRTSQGRAFTLTVGGGGVRFRIDWTAGCADGGKPFRAQTASQRGLPDTGGAFTSHETYNARASDGAMVHYDIRIGGRIHARTAAGVWRAVATGPYKNGGSYRCETGRITWKARRTA
ncbi:MAG TPA: hypothetical protein VHR88_07250 [Solirubrobacteraceae bacterium]|jgi:hypothetical protein|nr:hypothetical protein [Solirubrobacteraceae bacterium]